jgi:VIT1/CCC1 family predicted Fe2+/Mn2+ transporter
MNVPRFQTFAARYLDAGSRMGEILFGLIMTLTFTLGAGMVIQEEGREGARQMLIAILGCNLAWGLIDGIFYILGQIFERGRLLRLRLKVREAASDAGARGLVADELDELLAPVTDEARRVSLYDSIVQRMRSEPRPLNRIRKDDFLGGLAAGWLVFICSFPAALPFLFIDDPRLALRVSNALLLLLLFVVGYRFAKDTMARPWFVGTIFLLVGVALVALTIALGG